MATFEVLLKQSDEGFAVWVPALTGCASQGDTEEEALANIRDAIADYLAVVRELHAAEKDVVHRTVHVPLLTA